MKQWSREQIIKGLYKLVPEINFMKTTEEFYGKKGGIWTSGESVLIFKGIPPFNATLEYGSILLSDNGDTDSKHKGMKVKEMYICGIHREIYSWLEERGWYPEWYDAGTLLFWKNKGKHKTDSLKVIQNNPYGRNDDISSEILKILNKQAKEWGWDVPKKKKTKRKNHSKGCI
ncbi:MAG: hypothetical protein CXT78_09770 [Thaumarchaeota archaeon]|jgi:hypothetical protein|nr:MAG: hypothetical protein CXT78_09770 [Nitrososphaerota archaeon]